MLRGTLVGRRPAWQVIVSTSSQPGIRSQYLTPVSKQNHIGIEYRAAVGAERINTGTN